VQFNCLKKNCTKNWAECWLAQHGFPIRLISLFCQLCWVPWDDAIVVSASKQRKLWDCRSELRSSLCERRLERIVLRPALLPVKTAQFTQFFRQVWRYTVKSLSLTGNVEGSQHTQVEVSKWGWTYQTKQEASKKLVGTSAQATYCQHRNEPLGSKKGGKFVEHLSYWQFVNTDSVQWK